MDVSLKLDAWLKKVETINAKEPQAASKITNALPSNNQNKFTIQKTTESQTIKELEMAKQAIAEALGTTATIEPWLIDKEKMIIEKWGTVDIEVANNFIWFYRNLDRLPLTPFTLNETSLKYKGYEPQTELRINNPENFYKTFKADINFGPSGCNGLTQVLQNRVKLLRRMVE